MTNVRITVKDNRITTDTPYHAGYIKAAKALGGRWNAADRVWQFDAGVEDRVRAAMIEAYGTDGQQTTATVTIHVKLDEVHDESDKSNEFVIGGRTLVRRRHRDCPVTVGDKCSIVEGSFPEYGGSMRYPSLNWEDGTIMEAREVPESIALRLIEEQPDAITIIGETKTDRDALMAERERLLARIAEIDALLA
ncbi:MAG: hypothetical protein QM296_02360 [Bacillota bacterium]|nr:hypothetical protein [Bacillota bacterium]